MARKRLLTAEEAVLLHLLEHLREDPDGEAPLAIAQAGISRAIGVRRSHVSQSLDTAIGRGLVEEHISRVKGETRKRKCYFLTHNGLAAASDIQSRVGSARVSCRLPDGSGFNGTLSELVEAVDTITMPRLALLVSGGELTLPSVPHSEPAANRIPPVDCFVGRKHELARFGELFDGRVRILFLTGMPGIGKTWLAAKSAAEMGPDHAFWYDITEWSSPRHASGHLADFFSALGHHRLRRYLDAREVPELADLQDILSAVPFRIVLIFDDCQNATPGMVMFLKMLAAVTTTGNLGLVLLGRRVPDIGLRVPERGTVTELVLEPLDPESSVELLRGRGVPEANIGTIARQSGGHPLYLSLAVSNGAESEPGNMTSLVAREIWSTLPDAANRLLYQLSVFRIPVGSDALVETPHDLELLDELKARCIVSDRGGWSTHALLKDFYYARQAPAERVSRHERAAEFYNARSSGPESQVEEIYHLLKAGDFETGILAMVSKGNDLLGLGYVDEVMAFLEMVPEDRQNPDEMFALKYLGASAMDLLGDWTGASAAYGKCLELAAEPDTEADVLRHLGAIRYRRGDMEGARELFGRGLGLAAAPRLVAELQGSLGVALWKSGDITGARDAHTSDMAISESENDLRGMARALNNLGILDWQSGDASSALKRYARALGYAGRLSDNRLTAILYSNIGDAHRTAGNNTEARRYYERCLELAEELKFNWQIAEAYRGLAEIIPDKRGCYLSRALAIFERLGADDDAKAVREMMR